VENQKAEDAAVREDPNQRESQQIKDPSDPKDSDFVIVDDEFVEIDQHKDSNHQPALIEYDPLSEYKRMGFPGKYFRFSSLNDRYQVTPTYPNLVIVPNEITDEEMKASAEFRSRKRFIAVTWKRPNSCQFIARCSQPYTGLFGKSQPQDVKLMNKLAEITLDGIAPDLRGDRKTVI
jgi:hypothetical protein